MESKYPEEVPDYINELLWQKNYPIKEEVFYISFENLWKKLGGYECIKTENGYKITRTFLKNNIITTITKDFPKDAPIHGWDSIERNPKGSVHRFYDSVCNILEKFDDSLRQVNAREIFEEKIYEFVKMSPFGVLDDYMGFKTAKSEEDLNINNRVSPKRLEDYTNFSLETIIDDEDFDFFSNPFPSLSSAEFYARQRFFDNLTLELLKRKGYPLKHEYFHDVLEEVLKNNKIKFDYDIFKGKFRYFLSKGKIRVILNENKLLDLDLGYPPRSIGYIKILSEMIFKSFNVNLPKNLEKVIEDSVVDKLIEREEEILDKLKV